MSVGDGLYLNLRHKSKTWVLRRRIRGKNPRMPVREARVLALQIALEGEPSELTVE